MKWLFWTMQKGKILMNKNKTKKITYLISKFHDFKLPFNISAGRVFCFLLGGSITYLVSASASYQINPVTKSDGSNTIYYPFGMASLQPPDPTNVITIKAGIGVTAKQVCGYTDWSSAALVLPTQLLSAGYWQNISGQLQNQAIQLVTNLSGALPQMVACNVSPTFCHVLNVAQELAQQEFQFTANTCKMLDNISDALPKNTALASCIQNVLSTKTNNINDPGQAREYCIVSNGNTSDYNAKIANVSTNAGTNAYGFSSTKVLNSICPETSSSSSIRNGLSPNYNSGTNLYSQITDTCSFAGQLFPGFDVGYSGRVSQAGTFQSTVNFLVEKNQQKMSDDILVVVNQMYSSYRKGKTANQVMSDASGNWSQSTMSANKRAPLYLRGTSDGSAPQFLIPPQQMYQLTQLIDPSLSSSPSSPTSVVQDNYKNASSPFKQAMDRVVGTATYISVLDSMNDLRSRVVDVCSSSSDLQGEAPQANCQMMQGKLAAQMQYLQSRMQAEQSVISMQKDMNNYVQSVMIEKNNVQRGSMPLQQLNNSSKIDPSHM